MRLPLETRNIVTLVSMLVVSISTVVTTCLVTSDPEKVGREVVAIPLCIDPCTAKPIDFYECYHDLASGDTCTSEFCIKNTVTHARCEEGIPAEDNECEVHWDATAEFARQWKIEVAAPLECVDNGFVPVPALPNDPCFFGSGVGKCFVDACPGTVVETGKVRRGRIACGPGLGSGGDKDPKEEEDTDRR